jgi:hypothetical protein
LDTLCKWKWFIKGSYSLKILLKQLSEDQEQGPILRMGIKRKQGMNGVRHKEKCCGKIGKKWK